MPTEKDNQGDDRVSESIWDDPNIPAGNSPPLASWPLWLSAALWCGWTCVLLFTAMGS